MTGDFRYWWATFRDLALAALAAVVVAVGTDMMLSFRWSPRVVARGDGEALYYPWAAVGVVAAVGVTFLVAGFRLGLERQYYNWLCVATGLAFLLFGCSFAALERVEITADEMAVRRWWGVQSNRLHYDDLKTLSIVTHTRRRGYHWVTIRFEKKNGEADEFGSPRLLSKAILSVRTDATARGVAFAPVLDAR